MVCKNRVELEELLTNLSSYIYYNLNNKISFLEDVKMTNMKQKLIEKK